MVKLKINKVRKFICPTCKGNGFVKVASFNSDEMVHQCWDCDSEGEFYETSDNGDHYTNGDDTITSKLH
jgi:DnaJ-class molecular chaperone